MAGLEPFEATPGDPWDHDKAAHLLRRGGFGGPPAEVERLVELGPAAAVDLLVDYPDDDAALEQRIQHVGGVLTKLGPEHGLDVLGHARAWWLFRMACGNQPLQEKLTLFWHDHFACKGVRPEMMLAQNRLLRRAGAGPFRELLLGVARDPAMLVFLDGRVNDRDNPNENWGRELLELFTLGVDRYEQRDVVDVARAFTGWTTPSRDSTEFLFDPGMHDATDKRVFGEPLRGRSGAAGEREGYEVVERLLARRDCARHLSGKLLAWFVEHDPAEELVESFADELAGSGFLTRAALRTLFRSRAFYEPSRRHGLVKNPVEFAVSAARALELQNPHLALMDSRVRQMGMDLFGPPTVAGWDHGRSWLQTGYVVERFNYALILSRSAHTSREVVGSPALDLDRLAGSTPEESASPEQVADRLAARLLQRPLRPERREILAEELRVEDRAWTERGLGPRERARTCARAAIHLLLCTPEFGLA